jgi:uncharacterized protein (TIGR00255 family)
MITSMTGYGRAVVEIPGKKFTIEIKSLNSKQPDISLKMPGMFREKELEVRNLLTQKLERGKIDLFISTEYTGETLNYTINRPLARKYFEELRELAAELDEKKDDPLLPLVLKMPDVLQTHRDEINEQDWLTLLQGIEETISQLIEFRENEGRILEKDIRTRVELIHSYLNDIAPFEPERISEVRERLQKGFENFGKTEWNTALPDQNRFEQELIFYLEKLDITEEKVRLKKHCDYFIETMDEPRSQGKKLGFVTQEMGREINTIGSKANHSEIQKIVIRMKDELEKVKEQMLNIL